MEADLVFINGQVVTVDKQCSVAQALAVKGNKIASVGDDVDVKALIGGKTRVVDLQGRSLLPGFIDAHAHIELYGTNKLGVNCKEVASIEEMKTALKKAAVHTPKGEWVRGWGYNHKKLLESRHPTRWDLDEVSTEHPIIVVRTDGHISAVNSRALELAGIESGTPDPVGGRFGREGGTLNGVLFEAAHMKMFELANYSDEAIIRGLELASADYVRAGITSIHDAGGYNNAHFRLMQQAVQSGRVKVRIYALIGSLNDSPKVMGRSVDAGMVTGLGNERFRIGPAKVFIDGSSSGPTSATREPYTSDPNLPGILYLTQEELNESLGRAHAAGWQITAHAIGDKAVEMMLNCIERALEKAPAVNHRHRIEHAAITPPDLLARMKRLNVVPIPNPAFIRDFGDGYMADYGERVNDMFPSRSFLDAGIIAAIGSDSPITAYHPMVGIDAAVNRLSQSGRAVGEGERISLMEAIRMYTWNGAYASFEEDIKGSLEKGKLADMVVLDRPILDVRSDEIKEIAVDMTVIDGEIVFERG